MFRSVTRRNYVLDGVVNVLDHGVREQIDFGILARPVQHDFRGAKLLAAVHQRYSLAKAREEVRFLHGGIAAADHHDLLCRGRRTHRRWRRN